MNKFEDIKKANIQISRKNLVRTLVKLVLTIVTFFSVFAALATWSLLTSPIAKNALTMIINTVFLLLYILATVLSVIGIIKIKWLPYIESQPYIPPLPVPSPSEPSYIPDAATRLWSLSGEEIPVNDAPSFIPDTRYIPDELRRRILERDHYRCVQCDSPSYLELDHIIPHSKGGATSEANLQVLCHSCNRKKGNR